MTDRPHRLRHQYGAEHPFRYLHPSRKLYGVRVPIDLLPQNPLYVDEDSLVARGYADHVVSPVSRRTHEVVSRPTDHKGNAQ